MATVSPPRPASAATIEILEERARRIPAVVAPAITIVGVAVAMFLIYAPSFVNYDAQWALLWARDLAHGFTPEYTADFAPTQGKAGAARRARKRCLSAVARAVAMRPPVRTSVLARF